MKPKTLLKKPNVKASPIKKIGAKVSSDTYKFKPTAKTKIKSLAGRMFN